MANPKQTPKFDYRAKLQSKTSEYRQVAYSRAPEIKIFAPRFPIDKDAAYDNPELLFNQIDKLPGSQRA